MKTKTDIKTLEILSVARLGAGPTARENLRGLYFYERRTDMETEEITKKKNGEGWIYQDRNGEEIRTYEEDIECIVSLYLEPLRDFLDMSPDADEAERVMAIARALLERAEEKIYEATEYIDKNYGNIEIVKAAAHQSVGLGIMLDTVFTPAGNGKGKAYGE